MSTGMISTFAAEQRARLLIDNQLSLSRARPRAIPAIIAGEIAEDLTAARRG